MSMIGALVSLFHVVLAVLVARASEVQVRTALRRPRRGRRAPWGGLHVNVAGLDSRAVKSGGGDYFRASFGMGFFGRGGCLGVAVALLGGAQDFGAGGAGIGRQVAVGRPVSAQGEVRGFHGVPEEYQNIGLASYSSLTNYFELFL